MKILFVCLGNICRSPMAEGILRTMAKERGVDLEIDSCGTGDYHIGEAPDKRAQRCMKEHDDDISDLRARQFTPADFQDFDRIFVMDNDNYQDVVQQASGSIQKEKVGLFLDLTYPGEDRVVPDPYFGGTEGFNSVYRMLTKAADAFLTEINEQAR